MYYVKVSYFNVNGFCFSITGKMCHINIDECAINPCHNGGTCIDGVNSFTCQCIEGYQDPTCQSQLNECVSNPCIHGYCEDEVNGYGVLVLFIKYRL